MATFTAEQIRRRALRASAIVFLKSQPVAEAAASRVRDALRRQGRGSMVVEVVPSSRHRGTWNVEVRLSRLLGVGSELGGYAASEVNRAEVAAVTAALRQAFRPEDLVTSWTQPSGGRR